VAHLVIAKSQSGIVSSLRKVAPLASASWRPVMAHSRTLSLEQLLAWEFEDELLREDWSEALPREYEIEQSDRTVLTWARTFRCRVEDDAALV